MSAKPSFPRVLILIAMLAAIWLVNGCGDDDNPVRPTPEPSKRLSLGMTRTAWTLCSEPKLPGNNWLRGALRWHNPPMISRESVYSGEVAAGQGALQPLRLIFRPRGGEAVGPVDDPCFFWNPTRSWGGIMRVLNEGRLPTWLDDDSVFLEMRIKPTGGILHVDFGRINESIDGDAYPDTEDWIVPNGVLDEGEDTGFDYLMDEDELGRCNIPYDAIDLPDPAGDNWWYEGFGKGVGDQGNSRPPVTLGFWDQYRDRIANPDDWMHYEWQNGTEGNADDAPVAGQPDREALGPDGFNIYDAYLSYTIPLTLLDTIQPYIVSESAHNGWYTYRIPVWSDPDSDTVLSHPGLEIGRETATYIRIWFEQPEYDTDSLVDMDSLWIADWGLVGE